MHEGHMHAHGGKHHGRWHWLCCWLPVLTTIFWIASMASFIILWISVTRQANVWGYPVEWWIVNSLIFGVLALFGKGHGGCCNCCAGGDMYKVTHE